MLMQQMASHGFVVVASLSRVHLMNDTANRKMFYGTDCTLCTDSRVQVMRNSLLSQ